MYIELSIIISWHLVQWNQLVGVFFWMTLYNQSHAHRNRTLCTLQTVSISVFTYYSYWLQLTIYQFYCSNYIMLFLLYAIIFIALILCQRKTGVREHVLYLTFLVCLQVMFYPDESKTVVSVIMTIKAWPICDSFVGIRYSRTNL